MQTIIATISGLIVVFGLPTAIVRHLAGLKNDDGSPNLTYSSGLMWFVLVGCLGFAYVGVSAKFGVHTEIFAEAVGVLFLYIFVLYIMIGVPVLILYIFRLLR